MIDLVLVWCTLFGIWPLAHPEHTIWSLGGAIDITIHAAAWWALVSRWTLIRRRDLP